MTALPAGARLGRYELVRPLGEGGMGEVYEAVLHGPAGFRKHVALKRLKEGGEGLVAEARLGGLLRHRNLVETYALEEVDGSWVCAMELVSGGSLRDHLPLPPSAAVEVGWQVCAGLAHAHEEIGLVHLDLKPENLLVDGGVVKIADLGIARARGFTGDGRVRGTPRYMAPEHMAGGQVDPRADIYALGVVLRELLTGSPIGTLDRLPELAATVARCTAEDPSDRYPTMAALGEALVAVRPSLPPGPSLAEVLGATATTRPPTASDAGPSADTMFLTGTGARTNIGPDLDAMVGREAELVRLLELLATPGLVTVKGAGGLGKTRLARTAARRWHAEHGRTALMVDLAAARDPDGLVAAVAAELEVPLGKADRQAVVERLGHALEGRAAMLLLLDNTEQIADAAPVLAAWRAAAPELRLLLTSRIALRIEGERVFELDALSTPAAVELLEQRAGKSLDAGAAASLVDALDRLPLAIELVAGRMALMSADQVLARLSQRFRLLRGRARGADPRQATLRGALDWSWDLLDPTARAVASACALFAGGFTLEAAEAVVGSGRDTWVLDSVQTLLDHSFLRIRDDGRLAMFESTRAYALEQLEGRAEAELRHAAWFARLDPALDGTDKRIEPRRAEVDNLLVATRTALIHGRPDLAVPCLTAAWTAFEPRGPYAPIAELAEQVTTLASEDPRAWYVTGYAQRLAGRAEDAMRSLSRARAELPADDPLTSAMVENQTACVFLDQSDLESARTHYDRAVQQAEQLPGPHMLSIALNNRAIADAALGRVDEARADYERARDLAEASGDTWSLAMAVGSLGVLDFNLGAMADAQRRLERAGELNRAVGNARMAAIADANLGNIYFYRGDAAQALACYTRAARAFRDAGDRRMEAVLAGLSADAHQLVGELDEARAKQHRALALLEAQNAPVWAARANQNLALYDLAEGKAEAAVERLRTALPTLAEDPRHGACARVYYGEALAKTGHGDEAMAAVDAGLAVLREADWKLDLSMALGGAARARAAAGSIGAAREALAEAERLADELDLPSEAPLRLDLIETRAEIDVAAGEAAQ